MAEAIQTDPSLDMLYSDEDKLELDGSHAHPFFKPDWSPEYFLSSMYTCHLGVYRTSIAREVGGFRSAFDGAQDYDFALRFTNRTNRIGHVPEILYHWRMLPTSTSTGGGVKPEANERGRLALQSALEQRGIEGRAECHTLMCTYRVRYAIKNNPKVSIIIPSTCKPVDLKGKKMAYVVNCVRSIFDKSSYRNFEVIVLDRNQMPEDIQAEFASMGVRRVTYDFPFNWSLVNNLGAEKSTGEHLLFLNDDMEVNTSDWLESMVEFSQRPDIGTVGARLLFPDGRLQHIGIHMFDGIPSHAFYLAPKGSLGYYSSSVVTKNYLAVTGACLMTRRDVFESVGRFCGDFPMNYNDVDYCLKVIQCGKRVVYVPGAELTHFESASRPKGVEEWETKLFKERWLSKFPQDPCYNRNLTKTAVDYTLPD